ncbi:hypothetical protein [Nostoc sp. KVJ20]|uniref:hypothetical protein n=1 Tax=Nostoc sp. KVJ20 TaxID=457944 RepID=UPI001C40186F|nr:hypothetical protein [Nostoc sp. KVJ20]
MASNVFGLQFQWRYHHNGTVRKLSCTRDVAKLSASGVPCYASCQTSAVEMLYMIDTALASERHHPATG